MTQTQDDEPVGVHVWSIGQRVGLVLNEGYDLHVRLAHGTYLQGHHVIQAEDGSWGTYDSAGRLTATDPQRGGACMKHARVLAKRLVTQTHTGNTEPRGGTA